MSMCIDDKPENTCTKHITLSTSTWICIDKEHESYVYICTCSELMNRRRREEENISTTSILKKKIIKAEKNAMPHTVMVNLTISHFV